jgi:oligopeptidase B
MENMRIHKTTLLAAVLLLAGCAQEEKKEEKSETKVVENKNTTATVPPIAEKQPKEFTNHGQQRIDNYYWLRERENPKVKEYVEAENAYTKSKMQHTESFQEKLYDEMKGRIKQTDESVPYKSNGYYYYTRYEEGSEYPIHCRKKDNMEAEEQIMLNVNEMAKGHSYYQVGSWAVSPDNTILAFSVDKVSRRKYDIYFKNLSTGEVYTDVIKTTSGGAVWANDNKTVFYNVKDDETLREYKIMKHQLGTAVADDPVIYEENDDTFNTFVYKTKSKKYIILGVYSTLSSEMQYLDADQPDGTFKVFQPREKDHEYSVSHYGDKFYIRTNSEAKNFRLMECPVNATEKSNWTEVIAHREDVLLEGVEIFNEYMVIDERIKGLTNLRIKRWDDGSEHYLDFGEETYSAYVSTNMDFDTDIVRYGYSSLTTPNSTYDYNMTDRNKTLLKQQEVIGGYDPSDYQAERLYATAKDGVKVPISLVYKKGLEKNGSNPLLLYAYGSYGASMDPYFSSSRLTILDRGFVFAIAHIRGGEDMGRQWYEDGKLLKKKNTFTDFIACGEHLTNEKFTDAEHMFAMGGSAGGLLMGAIANINPGIWKGIVAQVPFVDVINTMLDESIPLTTGEYDEWGNPNVKEYYDYMLSYSPYDNVESKAYPSMLVTTGWHDSQVQYWEPAKWVAKLRDMKTDDNTLLLFTNMDAGHGGASGRFEYLKEIALEYAFMFDQLGITE